MSRVENQERTHAVTEAGLQPSQTGYRRIPSGCVQWATSMVATVALKLESQYGLQRHAARSSCNTDRIDPSWSESNSRSYTL